jgi:transposase
VSAGKTDTREGARYRKLAHSRGKAKACVAVGNTQMRVYHKLLSEPGTRYRGLGPDYYDKQRTRQVSHHVSKLGDLGYKVTIEPLDPETGELITRTAS